MQIVIPSRGRADTIGQKTLRLIPDALVCVAESEVDAYRQVRTPEGAAPRLLLHPDSVVGMGPKRQWILDNIDDLCVVMIDDDLTRVYTNVGFRARPIDDPASIAALIERTAIAATDAGVGVFGFCQSAHPKGYSQLHFRPITLHEWVGGTIGIIGRKLRYDTSLLLRADIDFCLQSLLFHRIIWMDVRYRFQFGGGMFDGRGGGSTNRTAERSQKEIDYLLKKWSPYLEAIDDKNVVKLKVTVKR